MKKTKNKKNRNLPIVNLGLTILLIFTVLILIVTISNTRSRINNLDNSIKEITMCDEKTIEEITNQSYKEDFYLNQLNNSTTIILSVIGFSMVIAGIFSYINISDRFKSMEKKLNMELDSKEKDLKSELKKYNDSILTFQDFVRSIITNYKEENEKIETDFNEMKSKLNLEMTYLKLERCFKFRDTNISEYVYFLFQAFTHHTKHLLHVRDNEDLDKYDRGINFQIKFLTTELGYLKKHQEILESGKIKIFNKKESYFLQMLDFINEHKNMEVYKLINEYFTLLEFEIENEIKAENIS